jgi:hypothetical protein
MTYVTATGGEFPPRRSISSFGAIPLVLAAFALASGVAAWLVVSTLPRPSFLKDTSRLSFDDRFPPDPTEAFAFKSFPPRSLAQSVLRDLEIKVQEAKGRLAQKLQSQDWRTTLIPDPTPSDPTPSTVTAVPLPRSRPIEATLESHGGSPAVPPDDRTLLQKFSDLLPGALASLAPDGGLLRDGPDLAALGYDNLTAVYDISARVVYMPNGAKLEAHSGFGSLMDDPGHVSERHVGATPPNVYDLKPRERLFHGVQALRMIPVDNKGLFGRSGFLTHSYMMGPNGDSNGCVSFKNYENFLKAFQNGEIKRLVVVASLSDGASGSRRSISQSVEAQ